MHNIQAIIFLSSPKLLKNLGIFYVLLIHIYLTLFLNFLNHFLDIFSYLDEILVQNTLPFVP